MRATGAWAAALLLSACVQSDTASTDWEYLITDEVLDGLPNVVFNLTEVRLDTGSVRQVTSTMAYRPQFLADGRLAFNGEGNDVRVLASPEPATSGPAYILGSGADCILISAEEDRLLRCFDPKSGNFTDLREASEDCRFGREASQSSDRTLVAFEPWCGPMTAMEATRLVVSQASGEESLSVPGGRDPNFDGNDLVYATNRGIHAWTPNTSELLVGAGDNRQLIHPLAAGTVLYFGSLGVKGYETHLEGRRAILEGAELIRFDTANETETVLMRSDKYGLGLFDISPDGKTLVLSFVNSRDLS